MDIIRKGYYEVIVNGEKISQHSDPYKAAVRSLEEKSKGGEVYVRQPILEPDIEEKVIEFLTQEEYDNIQPKDNIIYAII